MCYFVGMKTISRRTSDSTKAPPASGIIADWKARRIPLRKTSDKHGSRASKETARATDTRAPAAKPKGPLAAFQRILVPIDFSTESIRALKFAAALAKREGSDVSLIHVVGPVHDLRDFAYARRRLRALGQRHLQANNEFQPVVRNGNVSNQILEEAGEMNADVIVISTRSLSPAPDSRIGNIAKRIVRHSPCPVLVLPGRKPGKTRRADAGTPLGSKTASVGSVQRAAV